MKKYIILASVLVANSLCSFAQNINSAYFLDGFLYRHELNPAMDNDSTTYIAVPAVGNISVNMRGNFGYENILHRNPRGGKSLTTFMSPYLSTEEVMKGFNKNGNRIITEMRATLVSAGFKKWNGYNTIEVNARGQVGVSAPYELFEFARKIGNEKYDIGDVYANVQSFVEVAAGHSRQINEKLRVGAKAKLLFGLEDVDLSMKDMKADLSAPNKWTVSGDVKLDASMKQLTYESEAKKYHNLPGTYDRINKINVDGLGINGFGLSVDAGAEWKPNESWELSAALLDLGFISWGNNHQAINKDKQFEFNGFHDIAVRDDLPNSMRDQRDNYGDQIAEFINLSDNGDQGSRFTGIGTTINVGAKYTNPTNEYFDFGVLSSTRLRGEYSWTEVRGFMNWRSSSFFSASMNLSYGTFGGGFGWMMNFHPKFINLFLGMDYVVGKMSKEFIPLNSKGSLNAGFNIHF